MYGPSFLFRAGSIDRFRSDFLFLKNFSEVTAMRPKFEKKEKSFLSFCSVHSTTDFFFFLQWIHRHIAFTKQSRFTIGIFFVNFPFHFCMARKNKFHFKYNNIILPPASVDCDYFQILLRESNNLLRILNTLIWSAFHGSYFLLLRRFSIRLPITLNNMQSLCARTETFSNLVTLVTIVGSCMMLVHMRTCRMKFKNELIFRLGVAERTTKEKIRCRLNIKWFTFSCGNFALVLKVYSLRFGNRIHTHTIVRIETKAHVPQTYATK